MYSKIKLLMVLGLLTSVVSCSDDDKAMISEVIETGLFEETIDHDNLQREYLLYIPESYSSNEPVPLVFSLHGAGDKRKPV